MSTDAHQRAQLRANTAHTPTDTAGEGIESPDATQQEERVSQLIRALRRSGHTLVPVVEDAPREVTSVLSSAREGTLENMLGEEEYAARSRSGRTGECVEKPTVTRESSVSCNRGCWRGGAHLNPLCCHNNSTAHKAPPSPPVVTAQFTSPEAQAMLGAVFSPVVPPKHAEEPPAAEKVDSSNHGTSQHHTEGASVETPLQASPVENLPPLLCLSGIRAPLNSHTCSGLVPEVHTAAASNRSKPTIYCWNCGDTTHRWAQCQKPLQKFCRQCGRWNVTVASCLDCGEN